MTKPTTRPHCCLFWESPGYRVGDLATDTEVAGPFENLDLAWEHARELGYSVRLVNGTRGTVKHRRERMA